MQNPARKHFISSIAKSAERIPDPDNTPSAFIKDGTTHTTWKTNRHLMYQKSGMITVPDEDPGLYTMSPWSLTIILDGSDIRKSPIIHGATYSHEIAGAPPEKFGEPGSLEQLSTLQLGRMAYVLFAGSRILERNQE